MTPLEKKLSDKFAIYSILPKAEQRGFIKAYALLEDEIESLEKQNAEVTKRIKELTQQIEYLKSKI